MNWKLFPYYKMFPFSRSPTQYYRKPLKSVALQWCNHTTASALGLMSCVPSLWLQGLEWQPSGFDRELQQCCIANPWPCTVPLLKWQECCGNKQHTHTHFSRHPISPWIIVFKCKPVYFNNKCKVITPLSLDSCPTSPKHITQLSVRHLDIN